MTSFEIDPNVLDACRDRLTDLRKNAVEIMKLADKADPADHTWGMLGKELFEPRYEIQAQVVYGHLKLMGESLQARVEALSATVAAYRETDKAIAKALVDLHAKLGEGDR